MRGRRYDITWMALSPPIDGDLFRRHEEKEFVRIPRDILLSSELQVSMIRLPTLNLPWTASREANALDLEALARLCHTDIYRYALRRTGRVEEAEDIAADTFAAALDGIARFKGNTSPRLWLLGIARNKLADHFRRHYRQPCTDLSALLKLPDAMCGPEQMAISAEAVATMRRIVTGLPEAQREALLLQAADGLTVAEISELLGRSPSAINSLLGRARDTIRTRGADYFGDCRE